MSSPLVTTLGTLTAAGVTDYQALGPQDNIVFQVTVATIGTNVVVRLEGSLDATNWFNLDASEADTTLTANGVTAYSVSQVPVPYVRGRLVSLSGGTPSVVFKVALSTAD
ncbi:MAG: hypothetical protein FJ211_10280 [Ignavibacteria bacterium]|nr:hypothetical protein [Ignavibacteria bacterium]